MVRHKVLKSVGLILVLGALLFAFNSDDLPFDKSKIKGNDGIRDISNLVAPIVNQIWIASKKLSQKELTTLVLSKYQFKTIGYKRIYGLLIEIDENNKKQLQILEEIKLIKDIDNVYNRVYEGHKGFELIQGN